MRLALCPLWKGGGPFLRIHSSASNGHDAIPKLMLSHTPARRRKLALKLGGAALYPPHAPRRRLPTPRQAGEQTEGLHHELLHTRRVKEKLEEKTRVGANDDVWDTQPLYLIIGAVVPPPD